MVLSDGRAALLVSTSQQFVNDSLTGIWVLGLNDATCCAANHKFRLIYFGRKKYKSDKSIDETFLVAKFPHILLTIQMAL